MNTAKKTVVPLSKRYFTWATKHFDEIHTISLHKVHFGYRAKKTQKHKYTKKLLYKAYLGHSAGIFEVPGLAVVTDRTHGRVAHNTLADLPECELKNTIR